MWHNIIGGRVIIGGLLFSQKRNIKLRREAAESLRKKKLSVF